MKILNVVYYSHLGNTGRFVRNHLVPSIVERELPTHNGVISHQIFGPGPHQPAIAGKPPLFSPAYAGINDFLLVFPCYGRTNPETRELEDMVPMPIRDFVKRVENEHLGHIIGGVVCGNRTFGSDFTNVKGQFDYPVLGRVELAGSRTDADNIVSRLSHPALKTN